MVLSIVRLRVKRRQLNIQIRSKHINVMMIQLLSIVLRTNVYRYDRTRDARPTRLLRRVDRVIHSFVTELCIATAVTSRRYIDMLNLFLRLMKTHAYASRIKNLRIYTCFLLHLR